MRDTLSASLRFSPEIRQELIGRGLKRFLFCTVIIMHVSIFLLPLIWYFFREWLTPPPPKVIEVTLVENPTAEPHSKRGTQSASRKSSADSQQDIAAPPGKVEDISDKIPDTPDVPDISKSNPSRNRDPNRRQNRNRLRRRKSFRSLLSKTRRKFRLRKRLRIRPRKRKNGISARISWNTAGNTGKCIKLPGIPVRRTQNPVLKPAIPVRRPGTSLQRISRA